MSELHFEMTILSTWTVRQISSTSNNITKPDDVKMLRVTGTRINFDNSAGDEHLKVKINPYTTPRMYCLAIALTDGEETLPGLYAHEEDTLTLLIISSGTNGKYPVLPNLMSMMTAISIKPLG